MVATGRRLAVAEPYKTQLGDKGKREPSEEEMETNAETGDKTAKAEVSQEKQSSESAKEAPAKEEPKKSPAEEEKSGEMIGEQPTSQAEEILSEPILVPRNPLALISRTVIIVFFVDVSAAIVLVFLATLPGITGRFLFALAALLLLLKTAALIMLIIRGATAWTQHTYYLTERQLIHRQGIANIEEEVYELDNIRHVKLIQDFIGRQFDFGHIEILIATAGLTEKVILSDVKSPEHFKNVFSNYLG